MPPQTRLAVPGSGPGATPGTAVSEHQRQRELAHRVGQLHGDILREVGKAVIGQKEVIEQILIAVFSGGHCLLTGAPGLAKTLLVRTLGDVFGLSFHRIQFTPDLMPADISGVEILEESPEGRKLVFHKGPIFANLILADEINRTPPKTQSAMLEAMQERQVTVAGRTMPLPQPFFVLATQNPIEMEGTYPLPEAQLDRFTFNVLIDYPGEDDEVRVIQQTTGRAGEQVGALLNDTDLLACQQLVREVPVAEPVARFAVRLAAASRPNRPESSAYVNQWVAWGAGVRAAQCLILAGKARALLHGRPFVSEDDVRALAHPVLRHRILVNYRARAEGIDPSRIVDQLLDQATPAAG